MPTKFCVVSVLVSEQGFPMTTRTGLNFRGRYTDKEQDNIINLLLERVAALEDKIFNTEQQQIPESRGNGESRSGVKNNGKEPEHLKQPEHTIGNQSGRSENRLNQSFGRPQASIFDMAEQIVQSPRQGRQDPVISQETSQKR